MSGLKNQSSLSLQETPLTTPLSRSSSSLSARRARPSSSVVTVKRNSSNRSTASEGSVQRRRARRRTTDESWTASSFLRLVLPFSWERKGSNGSNVSKPSTSPSASVALQPIPPIPYPQRAPPPVPDQVSLSSGCSSLAGHIYEQVSFSSDDTIVQKKEEKNKEKGTLECLPGEVHTVKRSSKKRRKKSRSKATGTTDFPQLSSSVPTTTATAASSGFNNYYNLVAEGSDSDEAKQDVLEICFLLLFELTLFILSLGWLRTLAGRRRNMSGTGGSFREIGFSSGDTTSP